MSSRIGAAVCHSEELMCAKGGAGDGTAMTNPLYDALLRPHIGSEAPFLRLEDETVVTYAAFLDLASRIAGVLRELGLKPEDRVAAQVPKSWQALALYAGCVQAGAVFLPLNTSYTPSELDYFVGNSGASVLVCDPPKAAALDPVAETHGCTLLTLGAEGKGTLVDLAERQNADTAVTPCGSDDVAALLYTSGTTGRSKGAMLTHSNLLSNARALVEAWQFTGEDVLLHALPIFHTHGLFVACNVTLLAGGEMIFLQKFDSGTVIAKLPDATTMMGVPTFYTRLLSNGRLDRALTNHMRLFISGSAPLLAETHHQFEARTGHMILERYGMTETSMSTSNPYAGERRAGTVGPPLPGVEVKVCDPTSGTELPGGEVGMLEVRGPNVFKGYWQMPDKTKEELRDDGFFITGDLASIDEDGYVTIVGRGKDLIISGGLNIYPKEVELLLDEQPGVLESAVIGATHADLGESVIAVLVPQPGKALDLAAIDAAMQQGLAGFKRPRHYEVRDSLPRNTMGKVQKNDLRKQYADAFQTIDTRLAD